MDKVVRVDLAGPERTGRRKGAGSAYKEEAKLPVPDASVEVIICLLSYNYKK